MALPGQPRKLGDRQHVIVVDVGNATDEELEQLADALAEHWLGPEGVDNDTGSGTVRDV